MVDNIIFNNLIQICWIFLITYIVCHSHNYEWTWILQATIVMGNLKEVRSPKDELLYYVEVEENETKKRRSKAKARSKPKSNS